MSLSLPVLSNLHTYVRLAALASAVILCVLLLPRAAAASDGLHVIQAGESLGDIAYGYDVDIYELIALNNIVDPNLVIPGQQLLIPGTRLANPYGSPALTSELPGEDGYYVVQAGDSLSTIALRHDLSVADLMWLNGLDDPSLVQLGERLRVSARAAAPEPLVSALPRMEPAGEIYIVEAGDSLASIARHTGVPVEELLVANGLPNANLIFQGQRLRIPQSKALRTAQYSILGAPADGARRVLVDLSDQTLTAYQGDVEIFHTTVSTGRWPTPTVEGTFAIDRKYQSQDMYGEDYYLPDVPWVMYFYQAYAIHGAYWHANFGTPTSHGCVNMRPEEAQFLFEWADAGTEVEVVE
jgi:lipoprotein-anchoring transpeptidase ErfK/SrfK